jgi:hypothetical protein
MVRLGAGAKMFDKLELDPEPEPHKNGPDRFRGDNIKMFAILSIPLRCGFVELKLY